MHYGGRDVRKQAWADNFGSEVRGQVQGMSGTTVQSGSGSSMIGHEERSQSPLRCEALW
jgi:hypothetical protein